MNDAAKDIFRRLGRVPARIHMVSGCVGSGKSCAMEMMALFTQFGHLPYNVNLKTAETLCELELTEFALQTGLCY